jgi:peptidyl-prolyl cis-trans isomerase B (cyclophilin B)
MARRLLPLLCLLTIVVAACGDDDTDESAGAKTAAEKSQKSSSGGCPDVKQPATREDGGERRPTEQLDTKARYDLVLDTSCGRIDIRIDQRTSPRTAASVVALARNGFYDETVFHRIVPGFVIQGGDPTGSGMGGPGYSVRDTPAQDTTYL